MSKRAPAQHRESASVKYEEDLEFLFVFRRGGVLPRPSTLSSAWDQRGQRITPGVKTREEHILFHTEH